MLGFIGGSGFYEVGEERSRKNIETDYGCVDIIRSVVADREFAFIPRHGKKHTIPPHKVKYHANVSALKKEQVSGVLSVVAVGSMEEYIPGDLVLIDDFISFWMGSTFYDSFESGIRHVDFSEPFDHSMKNIIREVANVKGIRLKEKGIVATTPGPRFETRSEVMALKGMGANLVSMTLGHEAPLLGEAEIPHAYIGIVTNKATGFSADRLNEQEVMERTRERSKDVLLLLEALLERSR